MYDNCGNRNAVWGAMEDLLIKNSAPLFVIEPALNPKGGINMNETIIMGIDVVSSQVGIKPAIGSVSITTNPLQCYLGSYSFHLTCLPRVKKVIGIRKMERLATLALTRAIQDKRDKGENLPTHLLILRRGQSEQLNKEIISKEVFGIQRAINKIKKDKSIVGNIKLKLKITFIVIQRGCVSVCVCIFFFFFFLVFKYINIC